MMAAPCVLVRGVYYIKRDADGAWKSGTIISDRSIRVVGFTEDLDVRTGRESGIRTAVVGVRGTSYGMWGRGGGRRGTRGGGGGGHRIWGASPETQQSEQKKTDTKGTEPEPAICSALPLG